MAGPTIGDQSLIPFLQGRRDQVDLRDDRPIRPATPGLAEAEQK
jgi:hypothetical protein